MRLLQAVKETACWLEEHAAAATTEDIDEQKEKPSNVGYLIDCELAQHQSEAAGLTHCSEA